MKAVALRKLENSVLQIEVKVTREFRARMWIALRLITFAWWIAGGRVEITRSPE